MVFVPVFFAGVVFAASFRDSPRPDLAFGSNIGGAILGGLSENLSLVIGFNNLLIVAMAYYALSALLVPGRRAERSRSPIPEEGVRANAGQSARRLTTAPCCFRSPATWS